MENLLTYLKWRGDVSFLERSFNDVDNLVLSELAYLDLEGIVPSKDEAGEITLADALLRYKDENRTAVVSIIPDSFIELLLKSKRFSKTKLSKFIDKLDVNTQIQFSAFHIRLDDETTYVTFRGTGDELVGWREDFSMSYQIMPSQALAANYLKDTLVEGETMYRLGGHSKGGNLAIYAGTCLDDKLQSQILEIYSNDGPGLCSDIIDIGQYNKLRKKIIRISPEGSVVGRLFETDNADIIVKSSATDLMAHDGFTWEVDGDYFVNVSDYHENSDILKDIIDGWLLSSHMEQKEQFTKDFFDALEAGGAKKLSELSAYGINGIEDVLISLARSEYKTKAVIGNLAKVLGKKAQKVDWIKLIQKKNILISFAVMLVGLVIIADPLLTGKVAGIIIGLFVLYKLTKQTVDIAMSNNSLSTKKWKLYIKIFLIMLIVSMMNQLSIVEGFTGLVISASFFYLAYREANYAFNKKRKILIRIIDGVVAFVSLLFGIIPATSFALDMSSYTLTAGTFVLIYGTVLTVKNIRDAQNQ